MQLQKRPCTNRWRTAAGHPQEPYGLVHDPWKEPGWTALRCAAELCVFKAARACLWHVGCPAKAACKPSVRSSLTPGPDTLTQPTLLQGHAMTISLPVTAPATAALAAFQRPKGRPQGSAA